MTGVLHAVATPHGTGLSRVSKPRGRGSKGTAGHAGARGRPGLGRAARARRRAGAQGAVSRSQPAAVKRRGRHRGAPGLSPVCNQLAGFCVHSSSKVPFRLPGVFRALCTNAVRELPVTGGLPQSGVARRDEIASPNVTARRHFVTLPHGQTSSPVLALRMTGTERRPEGSQGAVSRRGPGRPYRLRLYSFPFSF